MGHRHARNHARRLSCHEATTPDFLGPIGVDESLRDIGRELVSAVKTTGYGHTIIGSVGSSSRQKAVGATPIPDSAPGIYAGMLPSSQRQSE